ETVPLARRFWELLAPHRTVMAQAFVGALVFTLLGLATSIYVQKIVDYVLIDGNRNLLNLMSVIMVALLGMRVVVGGMKSLLTLRTGQRIDGALILGYYRHLLALPQQFFDTMRVGEILARVNDAVKIRAFINDVALDVLVNAALVVSQAFTIALLWVGAQLVMARGLTPGELMSCYALIGYLTPPVLSLIGANRTVQDALVAADRLFEIMDLEREAPGDTMELTA